MEHTNNTMFRTLFLMALVSTIVVATQGRGHHKSEYGRHMTAQNVTYDGKSLFINGRRELLFSGSIHYPRSTPDMWPVLLDNARRGGINVIQTYVFWNAHEPIQGQFNFEGNYDLVKFIKLVQEFGMFVTLRVGPFIQAEWNHGGLPYWLREVPDIIFRSDNEPYKQHMQAFVTKIVQMMKDEKLFAPQGGPIILAQIENEYNHIQLAYEEKGVSYVQWAANMAVALDVGVPWVMCKQRDAPDPVINACNGRHCGDTFSGPNKPYKPAIWTENWTAQYRVHGDPPSQRSAEDIAFSIARFFSKGGNLVNYYMYHGGTNFGRTSSAFTTTRYYDEAPLDEYGLQREPKWSHLRDVHKAVLLSRKAILGGDPNVEKLNEFHEIRTFEKLGTNLCAAFITNNHTTDAATINFRGTNYFLPPHSISVLPDCKTLVYNTQSIVSQHNSRNYERSPIANNFQWEMFNEAIPTTKKMDMYQNIPAELYSLLKDTTDYAWYTTSFDLAPEDLPIKPEVLPILRIMSLGHTMVAFVNGDLVGTAHGTHEEKSFDFQRPVQLRVGTNYISILAGTVGLPDSGAYMEHRYAGPKSISIIALNTGTRDITTNMWGHRVGLRGEGMKVFSDEGSLKAKWKPLSPVPRPLSWYRTRFVTPEGTGPVAIRMTGMGKGMMWINGKNIGRHWMNFLSPLGKPTQSEFHIPRSFLNPQDNLLVIFEEEPLAPVQVEILNVNRDTICSFIAENDPPNVNSWVSRRGNFHPIVPYIGPQASLMCAPGKKIMTVEFASFGNPSGYCGEYILGTCNAVATKQIVEQECLGKETCSVALNRAIFNQNGVDPCPEILVKTLAIQVRCS
ncbi:beta-galactosidase 13-like [Vigna umbellata]|uniref:beta-galactosidase 13-like n=1 Tax=Vigna umbellata TaxID=87088 RepID=UPI001F5F56C9|nr:beta-galactosidase 13-like [Vigna umbellata]